MPHVMTARSRSNSRKPKRWGPGPTALGFVAAFLLSTVTIIYTGLKVGAPRDLGSPNSSAPGMLMRRDSADVVAERANAPVRDDEDSPAAEKEPDRAPHGAAAQ